jgi:hypothetical protein
MTGHPHLELGLTPGKQCRTPDGHDTAPAADFRSCHDAANRHKLRSRNRESDPARAIGEGYDAAIVRLALRNSRAWGNAEYQEGLRAHPTFRPVPVVPA